MGKALALQLTPAPVCGEELPVFRRLGYDLGRVSRTATADPVGACRAEAVPHVSPVTHHRILSLCFVILYVKPLLQSHVLAFCSPSRGLCRTDSWRGIQRLGFGFVFFSPFLIPKGEVKCAQEL